MLTHSPGRRRGFTMLELLIVVSLIGLVSAMAFGRTSRMMTQWRVARAAQAYAEELQSAFAIVGRDRKPVLITYDPTKLELRISNRDATVTYRTRNLGATYTLTAANIAVSRPTNSVLVFPPGLAADSLTVTFSRNGAFRRVRMLRGGMVQICSNPSTLNGPCTPA